IDVVFLLVIFFMVATKFTEAQRNIEVQLPEVPTAGVSAPPLAPRVVSVTADGQTLLDGEPVTSEQLTQKLAAAVKQSADVQVVIEGDARTPFQQVAAAMAACRDANVTDLVLPVEVAAHGALPR
ncbi:MAG: biopolymer transporter ExbD, partial [Planctomycetales bacterium]|nr:biopolymer transporter ExbD [Planctomycetales bacterium]